MIHTIIIQALFYEHNNKHITLKIILLDVSGRYHSKTKSHSHNKKTMNFILDDDSLGKVSEILENIEAKLGLEINDYTYDSGYARHFKTKVTNETCFRKKK